MLTNAGIAVVDALHGGREATVEELADVTGRSTSQIYRVVDELHETGLLAESRGPHNRRVLRATDHPTIEAYRNLTSKLGHVDWPDLLSPATIRLCWYLDEPRRATTIADRLDRTRQAVHHALSPLKDRAMLAPAGPEYALAADLRPLLDFVRAVVVHEHRTRVRNIAPGATVEWCDPNRALVHVHEPEDTAALRDADEWQVTGLARFEAFGLQFYLAGEPAFWYAPGEELTPSRIVCHTLLASEGPRRVSYALLFVEHLKLEAETLLETAGWYDLESTVADMYRFLQDGERPDDGETALPGPAEYESLKSQYGVA